MLPSFCNFLAVKLVHLRNICVFTVQFCPIGYNLYAGRYFVGVPWWPTGKESAWSAGAKGYVGSIPGSVRSLGEGHGIPPQYSCLENLMDRGAWWATVHGNHKELNMI